MSDDNFKDKQTDQQWHNKAARSDYNPPPFYYWDDTVPDCSRIVAWSADCRQIREGFMELIEAFPESVDVLFKVRTDTNSEQEYDRWHGSLPLETLRQVVNEFAYYIFQEGYQVLCVLNPETNEYVALDDFGLLWFYSKSKAAEKILEENGFSHRKTPLVTEGGCYVCCNDRRLEFQKAFLAQLGLNQVY